ncbi:hypothetical protein ACFYKX_19805 [Cytobacillus sp. FJAT-54145]|uniref:Uncharacterized protein n=1 Tax=Cytobacillus spartinae TaxID=3299023 RepID=A0ABW6KF38_9BACI
MFFSIFLLVGNAANMFTFYLIGLTGVGCFILLTGIVIQKRSDAINKTFQTDKNYPTIMVKGAIIIAGIAMLMSSIDYWRDLPYYINKEFSIVKGKPTLVDEYEKSKGGTDIYITIDGKEMKLYPEPKYDNPNELYEKVITVYYLPHSDWIEKYEMQ